MSNGQRRQRLSLNRRHLLATSTGAVCLAVIASPSVIAAVVEAADDDDGTPSEDFTKAYKALVGDRETISEGITIELPERAENGNFVPVAVTVESPMTADDYIARIHVLSTANPVAEVATYHLRPINGIARVQSRIRLAKTQDVFIVAERSDGGLIVGSALVKVVIGGCGLGG